MLLLGEFLVERIDFSWERAGDDLLLVIAMLREEVVRGIAWASKEAKHRCTTAAPEKERIMGGSLIEIDMIDQDEKFILFLFYYTLKDN